MSDMKKWKNIVNEGSNHGLGDESVRDVAEGYTGRETKDGTWRVFKDGRAVAVAGPFKTRDESAAWIKKQKQSVAEDSEANELNQNEKITEEWSVLYDAEHARNLRARVRMEEGASEETVREWFTRTFQPIVIQELRKSETLEENPAALAGAALAALGRGAAAGVGALGRTAASGAAALGKNAAPAAAELLKNPLALKKIADLVKDQQAKNTAPGAIPASQSAAAKPPLPKGVAEITPTVGGRGMIRIGKDVNPVTQIKFAKEEQDREIRSDGDPVHSTMKSIHMSLNGDYSYDRQIETIKDIARQKDLPYEALLGAWIKDPDGFNKALRAVPEKDE